MQYETNSIYMFRPDGGAVTETREISTTETCNKCHTKLTIHGRRREFQYCILCHQPQTPDADMPELIHKIHMGANLPSVMGDPDAVPPVEGVPHVVSGHDYSDVHFPQVINNCVVCHTDEVGGDGNPVAPHADAWMNNPGIVACGACHDDVDFATGDGHLGGPQADDAGCAFCHQPLLGLSPILPAHTPGHVKLVLATTADDISVHPITGLVTFTCSRGAKQAVKGELTEAKITRQLWHDIHHEGHSAA